jgi:hypothetical protein
MPADHKGEGDDDLARGHRQGHRRGDPGIEGFAFNKAIAALYGFTNTIARANASTPAMKEAIRTLAKLMSPMTPHIAESIWAYQGGAGLCAQAPWPKADPALLVDDTVTLPIQINGKRRAEISVPKDMPAAEVEKIALADEDVIKFLAGQPVKKIIVVPGRIINVVVLTAPPPYPSPQPDLLLPLALAACGFTPAYGAGGAGAMRLHGTVRAADPTDKNAFDFVERIEERLGRPKHRYDLAYTITDRTVGVGYHHRQPDHPLQPERRAIDYALTDGPPAPRSRGGGCRASPPIRPPDRPSRAGGRRGRRPAADADSGRPGRRAADRRLGAAPCHDPEGGRGRRYCARPIRRARAC